MLGPAPEPAFDPRQLRVTADLRRLGIDPGGHRTDGEPTYHAVRRGVWIRKSVWDALRPVARHAAFVHATALVCLDPAPVSSHTSAAAISGLPRIERWPTTAHVLVPTRQGSSPRMRRHLSERAEGERRHGLQVTGAARTVVDLARTNSLATGLAAADYALRHRLLSRDELLKEVALLPYRTPRRGRAALVVDLADARSMSAGESLSRAQMFLLNLPRPDLQVKHTDSQGLIGYVDFEWDGLIGEFDGRQKYGLDRASDQEEMARILWEEKRREDRPRAPGTKVARWVYAEAIDQRRLAARLAEQGLRPQRRNTWFTATGRAS